MRLPLLSTEATIKSGTPSMTLRRNILFVCGSTNGMAKSACGEEKNGDE
jgi:hypothetical protein